MKVSIITVAFNSEKTIKRTIESVLNQTAKDFEYIVVDGKSTDNTLEIVKSYEQAFKDKGIEYKYISEKDSGIYDAMNKGIKLAKGEIVGMINSDDWYELNTVEEVIKEYEKEKFDFLYANLNLVYESGKSIVKKAKLDKMPSTRHWNHPTSFITKETYNQVGLYANKTIYDDWDMVLRIRKSNKKVVVVDKVLANFTMNGVSHSKSLKKALKRVNIKYKIYKQNGYGFIYWPIECFLMEMAKLILG